MRKLFGLLIIFIVIFFPMGLQVYANAEEQEKYIVEISDQDRRAQLSDFISEALGQVTDSFELFERSFLVLKASPSLISVIQQSPYVRHIEKDYRVESVSLENSQQIPRGIRAIEADRLFSKASPYKIAVIDTGVTDHPDLNGVISAKVTFLNGREYPRQATDNSENQHGTHVAGTIAALNNGFGVVGITHDAKLFIVKALNSSGDGYVSDVVKAIQWSIDKNVDVINLSLGMNQYSSTMEIVIKEAYKRGIIVVAAAGNDGGAVEYPARSPYTIAVGAADDRKQMTSWSARGEELDVLAPGVQVLSTVGANGYAEISGTSMAAPHVSGAVAKLLPKYRGVKNEDRIEWVRTRLKTYADYAMTTSGTIMQNFGTINLYRSYYGIPYLSQNIPVLHADGTEVGIQFSDLYQYSDNYQRISIQTDSGIRRYQLPN